MSVDDAAEAMDGYERQRAALLASVPRMPHHWQEAGRSLYEQAHLARRLGRHPESRALMLEAVTRLGSIALPQAWFEVADWAWEDGDHDVAGRLYHDAMFKTGGCTEEEAQRIVERLRSLGDDHGHPWVWAALMRASLGDPGEDSAPERLRAIEAMHARAGGLPAALRIRARARDNAGDLEGAAADLDACMARSADPRVPVWRALLDYRMGRPFDLEAIQWPEHPDLGGGDYYSAGCELAEVVELLQQQEGQYTGSQDLARVKAVEARAYELGAARFEHYFATGEGGPLDAEPHIYAMLCNNLAIAGGFRQEKFAQAIPWHDKGWAVSPFWEQYHGRLRCQARIGDWAGVVDSWTVLRRAFGDGWPVEQAACEVAWAFERLGQPAQVLELMDLRAAHAGTPLSELISDVEAETRRAVLMALGAQAAARLGQRGPVERIARELLASDRLSDGLCRHLAQAWRLLGDEAQAERCERALDTPDPHERPALAQAAAPEVAAMLGWARAPFLDDGYAVVRFAALSDDGWSFELRKDGEMGDETLPIYAQIRRGGDVHDGEDEAPLAVPTWQFGVLNEAPGLFGRLRGKAPTARLYLAHSPTGHAPPAEWTEAPIAQLPPVWAELQRRVSEADAAWQRLAAAAPLERIEATIARLHAQGVLDGRDTDLGICRIGPYLGASGGAWVGLSVDRKRDTDPTLPELAYDPYHFIYQIVPATDTGPAWVMYGFQQDAGKGRQIKPGDAALALAAARLFERALQRLQRWEAAR